ncbi:MAG TPA: Maf family protein [Caulobacteraceae bacterium]|nr:Maf family protein [Caulobacteraceae bacterium]
MIPLVLASKSAVRARLLAAAGVDFEAVDSGVDEGPIKTRLADSTPKDVAMALAEAKALRASQARPPALVIGADQTLDLNGRLFDKPASLGEARDRLLMFRGRSHQLHAAVAAARGGEVIWRKAASSTLTMRDFSDAWLDGYLARNPGPALATVGSYEFEGEGAQMFERVIGDYFAILGLPLLGLLAFLRDQGVLPR